MSIKIVVCDDDQNEIKLISRYVEDWVSKRTKQVKIECFESTESFSFTYEGDDSFDILLLDIQMPGQDGIEYDILNTEIDSNVKKYK